MAKFLLESFVAAIPTSLKPRFGEAQAQAMPAVMKTGVKKNRGMARMIESKSIGAS
jgi:hypothetical protein